MYDLNNDSESLIQVDDGKCVNCHACISACPVKFCNDGSGDSVKVNAEMCIGCGNCISACTHGARYHLDDFEKFFASLGKKEKVIAVVAPSIVANFPKTYLHLNGWLKSIGVEAIFDVSFGAELTVKSYIEHLQKYTPRLMISQPCPAIVSYIQIYKPELLKYLVPAHSPMLHAMKMIGKFFPQFAGYKIAAISPCLAKRREFNEIGLGDFNIGMKSLATYFEDNNIDLSSFEPAEYSNPPAERAVLFSSPGGLLETAERMQPGIKSKARKIEGVELIYDYLDKLPETIEKQKNPIIIDCLNCEFGCNAGSLTTVKEQPIDEIEYEIKNRKEKNKELYKAHKKGNEELDQVIDKYWEKGLYARTYKNLWGNIKLKYPTKNQLQDIYHSMHKFAEGDLYNCTSCGYNSCEKMATAIFNGLNRPENCHFYLSKENDISQEEIKRKERRLNNILETAHDGFIQIDQNAIIEDANYEMKRMLKKNDLVGRSFFEFIDEASAEVLTEQIELRQQKQKSTYELTLNQSDGNKIICLISGAPLTQEDRGEIGSFAMVSDITELKLIQEELLQSNEELEVKVEERTKEIAQNLEELKVLTEVLEENTKRLEKLSIVASEIDNAVIIADNRGEIEWVNEGFTKLFGKSAMEMQGKNLVSHNTPDDIRKLINEGIGNKKPVTYEFTHKSLNGSSNMKWLQTTITPILDEKGNLKKLVAIDSDISLIKKKEAEILQQKEEIETQRDEITSQRDFLKLQTKKTIQSINYAKRIQTALLPPDELLEEVLPDYFIYFKPRDIVSGDFYWTAKHGDHILVAAVDCTGHGVPGALMSMLGISFLNEIVSNYYSVYKHKKLQANFILNELRDKVKKSLRQTDKESDSKDGMDLSLVIINEKTLECQFAGAHNPMLLIRDGEYEVYKADRMPIGVFYKEKASFTNTTIQLQAGDLVYLFSDGYADQFSEATGRKFLMKNFFNLLKDISPLSMQQQVNRIDNALLEWKGAFEQVDDILIIGLKF